MSVRANISRLQEIPWSRGQGVERRAAGAAAGGNVCSGTAAAGYLRVQTESD